jgi:hypothetical protein
VSNRDVAMLTALMLLGRSAPGHPPLPIGLHESQWEEVVDALIGTPLDYLLDQVTAHDGRFWWKGAQCQS